VSERPTIKYKKSRAKSAITNGSAILPDVDHRSRWARRLRDIGELYVSDLGGIENVSTAEHSLIRRIATLTVELEKLEAKFANAGDASPQELDLYSRATGHLRRCVETLGIKRRPKDVTLTLAEHIAKRRSEADGDE
jgi:hypothetical protein